MAIIDYITERLGGSIIKFMSYGMYFLGIILPISLCSLIIAHTYAFFTVIAPVIKKRLGTPFGLLWCAIGLSLLYNICFNYFLAIFISPGNPIDL